jgi:predicted amidohydrolase
MSELRLACVQMRSGVEIAANITEASILIHEAGAQGAQFIATPEMTNLIDIRSGMGHQKAVTEDKSPALKAFRLLADELEVWLLIGSLAIALEGDTRLVNRSYLIGPNGQIAARYDKIHMFDVAVGDGQSYRESKSYRAGETARLAQTTFGPVGLTICYDVRFAGLYRTLSQAGAQIITCPAAFTQVTGQAHWHTLLKARAIENGAFIMAPAQGGAHEDGRQTYGHSLIVSPWGEIIAERANNTPGLLVTDINLGEVTRARKRLPSLTHDRPYALKVT